MPRIVEVTAEFDLMAQNLRGEMAGGEYRVTSSGWEFLQADVKITHDCRLFGRNLRRSYAIWDGYEDKPSFGVPTFGTEMRRLGLITEDGNFVTDSDAMVALLEDAEGMAVEVRVKPQRKNPDFFEIAAIYPSSEVDEREEAF